jgi:hypothetical protein
MARKRGVSERDESGEVRGPPPTKLWTAPNVDEEAKELKKKAKQLQNHDQQQQNEAERLRCKDQQLQNQAERF